MIDLTFPELSEDGDMITVSIRNPRTVPYDALQPRPIARDAQGNPIDPQEDTNSVFEVFANLIVAWHVYDATATGDDQPLLESPASAELYAKLPLEIQERISSEVGKRRNPTTTPTTSSS